MPNARHAMFILPKNRFFLSRREGRGPWNARPQQRINEPVRPHMNGSYGSSSPSPSRFAALLIRFTGLCAVLALVAAVLALTFWAAQTKSPSERGWVSSSNARSRASVTQKCIKVSLQNPGFEDTRTGLMRAPLPRACVWDECTCTCACVHPCVRACMQAWEPWVCRLR